MGHGTRGPGTNHYQKLSDEAVQERQPMDESAAMTKSVENQASVWLVRQIR